MTDKNDKTDNNDLGEINRRLSSIEEKLDRVIANGDNMNNHISFVTGVNRTLRYPLTLMSSYANGSAPVPELPAPPLTDDR